MGWGLFPAEVMLSSQCYWKFPTARFLSQNYEFVAFKRFVVGKNINHGGQQVHSCQFLGKKQKYSEDI